MSPLSALRSIPRRVRKTLYPVGDKRPLHRRAPFLAVGLPFLTVMVAGSFMLTNFTQIRYDRLDAKKSLMSQAEMSKIREDTKDLASTDVRELYFQLQSSNTSVDTWDDSTPSAPPKPIPKANRRDKRKGSFEDELKRAAEKELEIKRVERPEGLAEWGEQPKTPEERLRERERKLV